MHIVIFGLTISSSWGNGHATLWRSLVKAMLRRGHTVTFWEKNMPYYAAERDMLALPKGGQLVLYEDLQEVRASAERDCDNAGLAMCTSYCPDGPTACDLILNSRAAIKAFYDLDTPVTLDGLESGMPVAYLPSCGLEPFDIVLSYTGGRALEELESKLGARRTAPLYGSVDPESHYPAAPRQDFRAALSYLGTYAMDRQDALERLFLGAAQQMTKEHFLIGGAMYPQGFPGLANVNIVSHVPPPDHSAFFSSGRATLNITRGVMARYGHCPSGRLFEAAACGVPLLTDYWEGLETFFNLGNEIVRVESAEDVVAALQRDDAELRAFADRARARTLAEHTGDCRVAELERLCEDVRAGAPSSHTEAVTA